MAGTKAGAKTATQKILARDPDFYKRIGAKGGKNGHTGGFALMDKEKLRLASIKGGSKSRKPKKVNS